MLNINSLPDDCLRLIFQKLPISERLRLRTLVCARWLAILDQLFLAESCLHLFGSQYEVNAVSRAIVEHNNEWDEFVNHVLTFSVNDPHSFSPSICQLLPTLMPNIKALGACLRPEQEPYLPRMLEQWAGTLTIFWLSGLPQTPEILDAVWHKVRQMTALGDFKLIKAFRSPVPVEIYPILTQLKSFTLVHYLPNLVPILSNLSAVTDLILNWVYLSVEILQESFQNNFNLVNLEALTLGFIFSPKGNREKNYQHLFVYLCSQLRQLKSIDIMFADQLPLSLLIPHLSSLTTLNALCIYIGRHQLESTRPSQLPQLSSVTTLKLEIFDLSVEQFFTWIAYLFPNLEHLTLRAPDFDEIREAEMRKRFASGGDFPKLKKRKLKFV